MPAPKLLAKGSGELAARMRRIAYEHNIPVVENKPLARELYKRAGADQFVPEDLYPRVAKILIWVYAMRQARERNIPVKTFTVPMHDVDRAITDGEEEGFVKIHVREGSDTILGATIVARHAGDMINGISVAMVAGIGLRTLARVVHAYPTQAEAIKKAADAYNRTRLTPFFAWLARRWLNR